MIAKPVASAAAFLLHATAVEAQRPPTYFDRAAYVTCREADAMPPEAGTTLMGYLTQHAAPFRGVKIANDESGALIGRL
ncbi:hypothetical protein BH11PSE3_BH11PSE3_26140 [soil metagenome]